MIKLTHRKWLHDFDYPLLVSQLLDGLVIFLGIRYASWAALRIRIKRLHVKKGSAETLIEEAISIDFRALSSIAVLLFAMVSSGKF